MSCSVHLPSKRGETWGPCETRHLQQDAERAGTAANKVTPTAAKATAAAHLEPGQAEMKQHGSGTAESATTAAPAHAVMAHPASTQVLSPTGTQLRVMELEEELKVVRATVDSLTVKVREFREMLSGDGVK